ncbi:MAG: GNAT family N-acetyltransferase [Pseudomonadota bacterium]
MTTTITIPTLHTENLSLRAPKPADLAAYTAFRSDPVQTKHLGGPFNDEQAFSQLGEIVGHWQLRGFGRFIVADKSTDEALGVVGPFFPPDWPEREIAWSVFASAQGRSIAYEAVLAARQFAYGTLGWTTAISMIADANVRSIKLAERVGCTRDADYQHPEFGAMQVWRHPSPEALT